MALRFELPADHPHVAVVTLDRPESANALDPSTLKALADSWRRIAAAAPICDRGPGTEQAEQIRCAILTGSGERFFCSGMDMKKTIPVSQALARGERISDHDFEGLRSVQTAMLAGFDLGVPLICAVNGHCRGGGFDMMLASEMRVATPNATFALEEVALGLYPTGNASVMLPKQIGWVHAQEIMLTARPFSAARALELGLINRIVEPMDLMASAFELADAVAANAPLAVRATRTGVRELLHLSLSDAYRRQEELGRPLRKTEDAREAQRAFVEKRKPVFKGR